MRFDRFTVKAQEAIQEAQALAAGSSHPEIGPFHLLAALVAQDQGIVGPILERLGADPRAIAAAVQERLAGIGRVDTLRDALVFKGGTALRKCYFGTYRFSDGRGTINGHCNKCGDKGRWYKNPAFKVKPH